MESKFLGTKGLTSAEANYTANIVKELCDRIKGDIDRMSMFKADIHFDGNIKPYNKVHIVDNLQEKCKEIGGLFALSAWLREGIKAKDNLVRDIGGDNFETEFPEAPQMEKAEFPMTMEQIKNALPIDELAEYLMYEAKAAHIGKMIHEGGRFGKWFEELKNQQCVQIHPQNKDYIVYFEPCVDEKDLEKTYFELQKDYREAEQKVNYYKAKINSLLAEENQKIQNRNQERQRKYSNDIAEYRSKEAELYREIEIKRAEELKKVVDLRIIIPHSLQSTLDYVQTFSKK